MQNSRKTNELSLRYLKTDGPPTTDHGQGQLLWTCSGKPRVQKELVSVGNLGRIR